MGGRERSGWACRAFQRQKNRPFGEGERPACESSWGRLFSSQKLLVGATRVLTCRSGGRCRSFAAPYIGHQPHVDAAGFCPGRGEGRVGEEGRFWWWPGHFKKKK